MKFRNAVLILAALVSIACDQTPPKDTFQLVPSISAADRIELADAHGYPVAVSHLENSDVSIFGIVHENCVVVWVRYENFSDKPVEIAPDRISLTAVGEKGKPAAMKVYTQGVKGDLFKPLNASLGSVYRMLTGDTASLPSDPDAAQLKEILKKNAAAYESLQQVLLKPATLPVNESVEGYLISEFVPAFKYVLSIPIGDKVHRFELLPKKSA